MLLDNWIAYNKTEKVKTYESEKWSRSFIKSISWRIIGTLDTIVISYLVTGIFSFALSIGAIEFVTKMGLYVVHERVWNRIHWGKSDLK
ncbi:MAG TPA: hypothetical protein DCZ44_04015 [Flavobacteriaceae bacterium]|nr:hypothetical protein [Flavobacteriaceae bacterium]